MADFTSSGWVAGETVSVYAVGSAPPNGRVGSALATAVASSSGAAAFTGLSSSTPYVAVGGTSGRSARFSITQPQVRSIVVLTQADYDALATPDERTLYVVQG